MDETDLHQRLHTDPRWFSLMHEFNRLPIIQIHPSWLQNLPHAELVKHLREHPRATRHLSVYLCQQLQLEPRFWYDFPTAAGRIALLPVEPLAELSLYLGLCTLGPYLRTVVDRQRVQALKQTLGESAYRFALKRVPFLTRQPPRGDPPPADPTTWENHARCTGISLCNALLIDEPTELRQRLALKFPYSQRHLLQQKPALDPPGLPLIRKLLNEVASPWASFVN